jgi:hypothetical protein
MARRIEKKPIEPNFGIWKEQASEPQSSAFDPRTGRKPSIPPRGDVRVKAAPDSKDEEWVKRERAKGLAPSDSHRKRLRHSITVNDFTYQMANKIGEGNASRGFEVAIEEYVERTGTRKRGPKPKEPARWNGPRPGFRDIRNIAREHEEREARKARRKRA